MAVFTNINLTTSAGVAPGVVQYYERTLLDNLAPEMVHGRDAQKRTLPLHNGKRVQFRKFTPLSAITEPLAEGTTPTGQSLVQTSFTAMVKPYGGHVEVTDELDWYMLDNMHRETAQLLADQAALSLDTISRDAINASSNVQYIDSANNVVPDTLAATDVLTAAEVKKAVRTLKRANAKPFSDGFFHAIIHPNVVYDLTNSTNSEWVDISKYQDKSKIEKYELGTMYGVKFFESTNAKVFEQDSYLFGTTASLRISNSVAFSSTTKKFTLDVALTEDEARALAGKLVFVYDTTNTKYVPVEIEYATAGAGDVAAVYFRWLPSSTYYDDWTNDAAATIHPSQGGASHVDVYSTLIYGRDAFGDIELAGSGKSVEIIINPPGSAGAYDPLAQKGTIAWKAKGFCSVVLQPDFIVRVLGGATA